MAAALDRAKPQKGHLELRCSPDLGDGWIIGIEAGVGLHPKANDRPARAIVQVAELIISDDLPVIGGDAVVHSAVLKRD